MLVLVRHGRTEPNASGLLLGRADVGLDAVGRRQAAALARRVGTPARIIASPLARCQETAAAFGATVETDPRWVELDYGEYDRRPLGEVPEEVWRRWRSDLTFRPPGGETLAELGARVRDALDELAGGQVGPTPGDVVVVTHVSPIKAAVAWALAVGDEVAWRMFVAVASITRVAITPTGPSLRSFNETAEASQGPG